MSDISELDRYLHGTTRDNTRRAYRTALEHFEVSRRGNRHDNAAAESFFQLLKRERIKRKIYGTRQGARGDVFDYIVVFYNRTRRHSHLGGVSPEAFERVSM